MSPTLLLPCLLLLFGLGQPEIPGPQEPPAGTRQPPAGMLRFPDVSATRIVFTYANDLWLVPRDGGTAIPLASPPGLELFPRFSPDGGTIAFTGNYEGNRDLYTIPVEGGIPTRVTHHPETEALSDWTPDGRLLFEWGGLSPWRISRLYVVGAAGGLPEALPVPYGYDGAISPDGEWLAYTPTSRDGRTWKRYMGGLASDIWLFHLRTHEARRVTDWAGTDTLPMWHGRDLYYLSDAGPAHRRNIWVHHLDGGGSEQVTFFTDYDVDWPAIGPGPDGQGEIVFQLGPDLRLLDLGTRESRVVEVRVPGDAAKVRPRTVDAAEFIQEWQISPTGKRAVVEARGDIWTLPAKHGPPRNLTRSDGAADRDPAWSPDGRWIAWFSDRSGEYQLTLAQSDGKGETRTLTSGLRTFPMRPTWSPDSRWIAFTDKGGVLRLFDLEKEELREVDRDPFGQPFGVSWSPDSHWLAYARTLEDQPSSAVFLHDLETGESHQVTRGMFGERSPTFDRKGRWLFWVSSRAIQPVYSDLDTTFVYRGSEVLVAAPLRSDVAWPWLPKSDEEEWNGEAKDAGGEQEAENGAEENGAEEEAEDAAAPAPPLADDPVSGTWEGTIHGPDPMPPEGLPFTMHLRLAGTTVTGNIRTPLQSGELQDGVWDPAARELRALVSVPDMPAIALTVRLENDSLEGAIEVQDVTYTMEGRRTATGSQEPEEEAAADAGKKNGKVVRVEIELEGLEARSFQLPVPRGNFGRLAVNHKNQLLYARLGTGGESRGTGIRLFDLEDEKKEEKTVQAGAVNFRISADGKKLLVIRGGRASIRPATAGGSGKDVRTGGMEVRVDPRREWRQMFVDAWRMERDWFYDPNMHGVDWEAMRERYLPMVEHCASREDLDYVLGHLVAELNVGHAYVMGGGDGDRAARRSVGLLGCDFALEEGAYRITRIYGGADWDVDARGPLAVPGVDVREGDWLLAVDGMPLDPALDPWAPFQSKAGRTVVLTVSSRPVLDDEAREVLVEPVGSEARLRFRAWVEDNRRRVEEATDGRVGYVYVPSTGIDGQTELFRQFYGQIGKEALIVDERWNAGGQIPTRFIELLNRPATNFWATRDGRDWRWPPDSHQGPKCMLINGPSGSGGDAFPYYFRQAGLGKLIGTRTWGGLVGISGNPVLIDGGRITVPTFAVYETDGTWGVEGHGVEPDIEVVDDPSLMVDGSDPQLEVAIQHMLHELETHNWQPPARPAYPDRSGMGIRPEDR